MARAAVAAGAPAAVPVVAPAGAPATVGAAFLAIALLAGCASEVDNRILGDAQGQLRVRSMQSRRFDTADAAKTLTTVMATLQDIGFVLDKVDPAVGFASGSKAPPQLSFASWGRSSATASGPENRLKITVTVRPLGPSQLVVRANAEVGGRPLDDPATYQEFFKTLEKSMFLTAHDVD
jgi:hypothetical protein